MVKVKNSIAANRGSRSIEQMEAMGLVKPAVVKGGWQSPADREFREFAPDLCKDDTEGYGTLLQLLCDELALAMPGLFGQVSLTSLLPIPASTLRAVVEALDAPELKEIWQDDTTLRSIDLPVHPSSGDRPESTDSLTHPACQPLTTAWQQHGSQIATAKPLRDWLRLNFFKDIKEAKRPTPRNLQNPHLDRTIDRHPSLTASY